MVSKLRAIAVVVAILAMVGCIVAPIRVFLGGPTQDYQQNFEIYRTWFNWATLIWFISAPLWIVPELFGLKKDQTRSKP